MLHKLHELLREADIHKNQMVENQTDFYTASCFLVGVYILLYRIFSKTLLNIGNKEKLNTIEGKKKGKIIPLFEITNYVDEILLSLATQYTF